MRSQYIAIYAILLILLLIPIINIIKSENYFNYEINIEKYYLLSFQYQLYKAYSENQSTISEVNESFYNFCKKQNIFCIYNGSAIILRDDYKSYIWFKPI